MYTTEDIERIIDRTAGSDYLEWERYQTALKNIAKWLNEKHVSTCQLKGILVSIVDNKVNAFINVCDTNHLKIKTSPGCYVLEGVA